MEARKHSFVIAQAVALTLVIAALLTFQGLPLLPAIAAFAGVWGLSAFAYKKAGYISSAGKYALLVAATLLAIGIIVNVNFFTVAQGGTIADPVVDNPDMSRYFNIAKWWDNHDDGYAADRSSSGYALVVCGIWQVTGRSIFTPLVVNMLATLLTIVYAGVLARKLLSGDVAWNDAKITAAAMIATASIAQLLFGGTMLLKESIAALCIVVSAIGILMISRDKNWKIGVPIIVVSALMLGLIRHLWVVIPVVGLAVAARRNFRHNLALFAVGVFILLAWHLMNLGVFYEFNYIDVEHVVAGDRTENFIFGHGWRSAYDSFLVSIGYFESPLWAQILWLPVTAATQYIIPFPWNFMNDPALPPTAAFAKLSYMWYAFGGVFVYYLLGKMRHSPKHLFRVSLWALLFWLSFAWLSGGLVSRYGATLVPLLVPAVVYVLATSVGRKSFRLWMIAYVILLIIALIGAYTIQN